METVNDRLRLVGARFAFAFGSVVAFALGSIGPFVARGWPPLLGEMVFGYLVALLVTRIAVVVVHFLLAPEAERFRIVPMDTLTGRFWCRRLSVFVGWFAFGWVTVGLLTTFGFSTESHGRKRVSRRGKWHFHIAAGGIAGDDRYRGGLSRRSHGANSGSCPPFRPLPVNNRAAA
jgi:hypothetical protein